MYGLKTGDIEVPDRYFTLETYEGGVARWCPGCGDHAVLSAVHRDADAPRYDPMTAEGLGMSAAEKLAALEVELDRFAI